ncbi:unnamed protein product [Adineta ricciae]|uniref:Uncharacterized protein n=1 Tax=Adineta ricciae TaxID=249248 RepID=A0A816AY97_ADIRI|nr:unnamed protein product [Adineta ricciae]CAF1603040.1 unnamed protein product [Adineta ricciae]
MFHLTKLTLALVVFNRRSFVDGKKLINDIPKQMLHLNRFIFNIITEGVTLFEEFIPSSEVLCRALVERGYDFDCYTDYNPLSRGLCHIYSLPFTVDCMHIHSHRFPGGLFRTVRYLNVQDFVYPFEHEFFL